MSETIIALDVRKSEKQAWIIGRNETVLEEKRFRASARSHARVLGAYEKSHLIIESVGVHKRRP